MQFREAAAAHALCVIVIKNFKFPGRIENKLQIKEQEIEDGIVSTCGHTCQFFFLVY